MCHISDDPKVIKLQKEIKSLQTSSSSYKGEDKKACSNLIKEKKKELKKLKTELGITSGKKASLAG